MNINFCFAMNGGKTVAADVQSAHFDGVPADCTAWAEKVTRAAVQAVRSVPFERNPPKGLTANQFREKNIVVPCQRCCASCKHGVDMMDDGCYQCKHPSLKDGELLYTSMSDVCVAWEKIGGAK